MQTDKSRWLLTRGDFADQANARVDNKLHEAVLCDEKLEVDHPTIFTFVRAMISPTKQKQKANISQ